MSTKPRTPDHFPRMKVRNRGRRTPQWRQWSIAVERMAAAIDAMATIGAALASCAALGSALAAHSITTTTQENDTDG